MPLFAIFSRTFFLRSIIAISLTTACAELCAAQAQQQQRPDSPQNQTPIRERRVLVSTDASGALRLENDLVVMPPAIDPVKSRLTPPFVAPLALQFKQLLTVEINQRLGAPYVYGAAGPFVFDCSGFVWSVYRAAGVPFERSSARTFWSEFAPAKDGEQYKFGTLVFFNGLRHVGIVADENGFYHASRSNGVTYAPFNEYWTSRIDGFRKIPLPQNQVVPTE